MLSEREQSEAARRLLHDTAVQELLAQQEQGYFLAWQKAMTPEAREACWFQLRALNDFKTKLQAVADRATVAEMQDAKRSHA